MIRSPICLKSSQGLALNFGSGMAASRNWGVLVTGVLAIGTLRFGVNIRAFDCWKLPSGPTVNFKRWKLEMG